MAIVHVDGFDQWAALPSVSKDAYVIELEFRFDILTIQRFKPVVGYWTDRPSFHVRTWRPVIGSRP